MSGCSICAMAVESAKELMEAGVLPDEYGSDPEGASMYAYNNGWLCGGRICLNEEVDEGDEIYDRIAGIPEWVIALWQTVEGQDVFLPIAMAWDYWPIHGGTFTQIAEGQLDWIFDPGHKLRVGGCYVSDHGPIVGLVCWNTKDGEQAFFKDRKNPVVLIGGDIEYNWRNWGLL